VFNLPALVAHVDLLVTGVEASAKMVAESGALLAETSGELTGFIST